MTPSEIQDELRAFAKEVGPKADVRLVIQLDDPPIYAGLYPFGIGSTSDGYLYAEGADFRAAIDDLRAKWAEHADAHRSRSIKKMALAIIRITAEQGECTDAALRTEFDAGEINGLGTEACALANEMAGKGPFEIVAMRGANVAA